MQPLTPALSLKGRGGYKPFTSRGLQWRQFEDSGSGVQGVTGQRGIGSAFVIYSASGSVAMAMLRMPVFLTESMTLTTRPWKAVLSALITTAGSSP